MIGTSDPKVQAPSAQNAASHCRFKRLREWRAWPTLTKKGFHNLGVAKRTLMRAVKTGEGACPVLRADSQRQPELSRAQRKANIKKLIGRMYGLYLGS